MDKDVVVMHQDNVRVTYVMNLNCFQLVIAYCTRTMVRHLQLAVIVTLSTYHFTIKIVGQSPETACIPRVTLEGALPRSAIAVTGLSPIPHKIVPVICPLWFYLEQRQYAF
eukprot:COSAG02_NODE_6035_length_3855_cov_112.760117_2_plen_111_part_00